MIKLRVVLSCLLAGVLLAACGGSSGGNKVSAASYVHSICTAVGNFQTSLQSQTTSLRNKIQSEVGAHNYAAVKKDIVSVLDNAIASTTTARNQVDKAGTPNVANGGNIRSLVLDGMTKARNAFTAARSKLSGLDPNSAQFLSQLQSLGTQITQAGGQITSGFSQAGQKYGKALDAPAQKDAACQKLGGSG